MAKKANTTKAASAARASTPRVVTSHVEEQLAPQRESYTNYNYQTSSEGPYSLQSMLNFLNRNAALLFMGVGILVLGFVMGSLWQENKMLKDGFAKGGAVAQVPGAPAAPGAPEAPAGPLSDDNWKKVQADPAGIIGNKNAKVTIVEFTDYQCPFCSRHYTQTYGKLKEKYVDTGKVKIIFKDQPLPFHPNAKISANAARCGGDQGGFEKMHDALFANQEAWANLATDGAIAKFGELATAAGLNGSTLMDCVKAGKYNKQVEADGALGLQAEIGASGTPTFFIEKQPVVGAQDISTFEAEIEKALAS